jgi:hypothetical protein
MDIPECTGAIQPLHLLVDAQAIFVMAATGRN